MEGWLAIGALVMCAICLLDLPFANRWNDTLAGFFLANGRLKLSGFVVCVLSANLSIGNFLIFVAAWGFMFGWAGLFWFLVNLVLNVVAYNFFIPAFRQYLEDRNNSGTIHEFLASRFGQAGTARRIRLVASATTVLGLLFAIVFEIHLASELFAGLLKMDIVVIFAVLTAFICIYSAVGGFHTLVFTDLVQSIVMIGGAVAAVLLLFDFSDLPKTAAIADTYPFTLSALDIGWSNILGICVVGSGWFLVAMDQWQRACATRDTSRTKAGMLFYLGVIATFAVVFGCLGMMVKTAVLPALSPELLKQTSQGSNPLMDFFIGAQVLPGHETAFVCLALALLAAAMSTANTFLIVCGHSFVSDILLAVFKNSSLHAASVAESKAFVAIARGAIIAMGIFVIVTWLLLNTSRLLTDPLTFFFIAYSIQFALLAPMVFARFSKSTTPTGEAVFHSIWVGVLVSLVWGLGWWSLPTGFPKVAGLSPGDWVALSPVIAWIAGTAVLTFGRVPAGVVEPQ